MPILQNPTVWTKQPPAIGLSPSGTDPSDSIVSLIAPQVNPFYDLVQNRKLTYNGGTVPYTKPTSQGIVSKAGVRGFRVSKSYSLSAQMSILWVGELVTTASDYAVIGGLTYDTVTPPYYNGQFIRRITAGAGGDTITFAYNYGGTFAYLTSSTNTYVTGKYVIIGTFKSGRQVLYIRKIGGATEIVTSSNSGAQSVNGSGTTLSLGDITGTGRNPQVNTALQVIYNRELNTGQVKSLLMNPWQIFSPVSRKLFTWDPPKTPTTGTATMVFGASAESAIVANATGTSSLTFGATGAALNELTYLRLSDGNIYNL